MRLLDAFRRRRADGAAGVRARLEGAMAKRRLRGWQPPLENVNSLVASGGPRLLARARELVVTNGYAANACEAFAANLVGDGIKPSSVRAGLASVGFDHASIDDERAVVAGTYLATIASRYLLSSQLEHGERIMDASWVMLDSLCSWVGLPDRATDRR